MTESRHSVPKADKSSRMWCQMYNRRLEPKHRPLCQQSDLKRLRYGSEQVQRWQVLHTISEPEVAVSLALHTVYTHNIGVGSKQRVLYGLLEPMSDSYGEGEGVRSLLRSSAGTSRHTAKNTKHPDTRTRPTNASHHPVDDKSETLILKQDPCSSPSQATLIKIISRNLTTHS